MRVLGIDVGSVRVGVAMSDPLGMIASPLEVILRAQKNPFKRIAQLVEDNEVSVVVVGYPLRMNGEKGPATEAVEVFVKGLLQHVQVPVELWDERLSTAQAQRAMIETGARREKRKQDIDKVAAALVLQSYLDAQSHKGGLPCDG
jgi:putative Holliday junction resolvase